MGSLFPQPVQVQGLYEVSDDRVPGIGPKRRRMLMRRFGSAAAVREATVEDIAAGPGLTLTLRARVREHL